MLYLAEVLRKTRVIGGGKAEFKLLACQRSEQTWNAVPGEEMIAAPDDVSYAAGVLVMLELSGTKQVQRHSEAGRQLVSILQNFSRLQEKSKNQGEEIEQWKESLTYQSQELNRRELELETRLEELQQLEEQAEQLQQQKQEMEQAQAQVAQLREEFERKSQELEGAWAQLHGETRRLEERQSELQHATAIDAEQARYLQELLDRIAGAVAPTAAIQEQLNQSFERIAHQETTLNGYWQDWEQQHATAQQLQAEVDQRSAEIQQRWAGWHEAQHALEQAKAALEAKQTVLQVQQTYAQAIAAQLQSQEALYQQVSQCSGSPDAKMAELENLPLETLQSTVQDLEKELDKLSRFVQGQEEELTLQQTAIDDLLKQIEQASEYDRLRLETELTDERDRYQMLNETLVGQRRNLQERQQILNLHKTVLAQRQGYPVEAGQPETIDLKPVLSQIDQMRQQQNQELQTLQEQIKQLQSAIEQERQTVEQQAAEQAAQRETLTQMEQELRAKLATVAEIWGKVNTYQATLQPMQEGMQDLRQKAEAIASMMTQFHEANQYQAQSLGEMKEAIGRLMGEPMAMVA